MSREIRIGATEPAPSSPAFAVSRDSAGILLAVRVDAAPQFAVSRDSDGLLLSVLPAPIVAYTYTVPVIRDPAEWVHYIYSYDTGGSYAAARAGSHMWVKSEGPMASLYVGQWFISGFYEVFQSYLRFDTSVIPDDEVVTSVVLAVPFWGPVARDSEFTIEARVYDAGGEPIGEGAYVPGADLSAKTLFATLSTVGGTTDGELDVPAPFVEAAGAAGAINKTGITGLLLCSDHTTNNVAPTGSEYVFPRIVPSILALTITTSGPA